MNKDYTKSRIKLFLLYLGIIAVIVGIFSTLVLQAENQQFERFRTNNLENPDKNPNRPMHKELSSEQREIIENIISDIRKENLTAILWLDLWIILLSAFLSYYLSGKTLEPIIKIINRQKQFISDASHELKTPLTTIMTEAEVLNRDKNSTKEDYKEFATNVIGDVKHLNNLVISLLDMARMEQKEIQSKKEQIELNEFVGELVRDFRKVAKLRNITINFHPEDGEFIISSDRILLRRILSIFLDNSIKYNVENGSVEINLIKNAKSKEISISDTGIGIDKKFKDKIFERFYRVREDRNEKSFGLGLSIARQIAQILDIKIQVQSEKDKGTTFKLIFI